MPITGDDQALMHAQLNVMRIGASRLGYHSPQACVQVGGLHRGFGKSVDSYKLSDLVITETGTANPNKATFKAQGWEPVVGMEVIATLGSINKYRRLFAGVVLSVSETHSGQVRIFQAECVDWTWLLDGEPVYGYFTGSADEIAIELMTTYAPSDFTVRQVEAGLETVQGGITFKGVTLSKALQRLAKRVGARSFVDYYKDLYFRVDQSSIWTSPTIVEADLDTLKKFTSVRDLSQVVNRVWFEGGGANALTDVSVGETILPLTSAPEWWYGDPPVYSPFGVITGPQIVVYFGRDEGGGGAIVGTGASPSSGLSAVLAGGAGVTVGTHQLAYTFVTGAGESLASPLISIDAGTIAAPTTEVSAAVVAGASGVTAGNHRYGVTFVTAAGETEPGPLMTGIVTTVAAQAAPTDTPVAAAYAPTGIFGSYRWRFTWVRASDGAETEAGPVSNAVVLSTQTARITNIGTAPSGFLPRAYRTTAGGGTYFRVTGGTWIGADFVDGSLDGTLSATTAPAVNATAMETVNLSNIPVSTSALVTSRKVYRRSDAPGLTLLLVTTIGDNTTTTYQDTTPNASLGAQAPSSSTADAQQIALSNIGIGASGVTSRKVYMTAAGGSQLKLVTTIGDNTTTTYTVTMADGSLGANVPTSDTSGLTQPSGQVLAGATSLPVTGTSAFRSGGGWAVIGNGQQVIRYTGFTSTTLTGIPSSGNGAIAATVNYNSEVTAAPCLTGIPTDGVGSVLYTIPKGEPVNLFVVVEDGNAMAGLQAYLDADAPVVREAPPLQDRRLTRTEAIARATVHLNLRKSPSVRVGPFTSKDMNYRAGVDVTIALPGAGVNDVFQVQSVTIQNFTPSLAPDYIVQAADESVSVDDLFSKD